MRDGAVAAQIERAHIRTFGKSIGHGRASHPAENAAYVLVVETQHRQAIERKVVQKADEARLQPLKVALMRCQMVVVNIGDDGDQRLQVRERGVALIRLGDEVTAGAEARIAARTLQEAADDE